MRVVPGQVDQELRASQQQGSSRHQQVSSRHRLPRSSLLGLSKLRGRHCGKVMGSALTRRPQLFSSLSPAHRSVLKIRDRRLTIRV